MSYFTKMLLPATSGFKSFLLQVGAHGDATVYLLDENGNPQDFACGKIMDVLGSAILESTPRYKIVSLFEDYGIPIEIMKVSPRALMWAYYGDDSWAAVAKRMNGKGISAGECRANYWAASRLHGIRTIRYNDRAGPRHILTIEGVACDEILSEYYAAQRAKSQTPDTPNAP